MVPNLLDKLHSAFIFCFVYVLICGIASTAYAAKKAVVIGINKYRHHEDFLKLKRKELNLEGCVNDALEIKRVLIDVLSFHPSDITVLLDDQATREAIERKITENLVQGTKPGDTVFFYFSGHGFVFSQSEGTNIATLCPHDANPFTFNKLFTADHLSKLFSKLKGRVLIAVFDTGSLEPTIKKRGIGGVIKPRARARLFPVESKIFSQEGSSNIEIFSETVVDRIFFFASKANEKAWELYVGDKIRGVFTYGFIQELRATGGMITADELLLSLSKYAKSNGIPQTPILKSNSLFSSQNFTDIFAVSSQSQLTGIIDPSPSFLVEVWVSEKNKKKFRFGEEMIFSVRTESDGFLYLIDIDSHGRAKLLFPNYWDKDNKIMAGDIITVPGENFKSKFLASEPFGIDTIIAIVSLKPWSKFEAVNFDSRTVMALLNEKEIEDILGEALTRSATRGFRIGPNPYVNKGSDNSEWALKKIQIEIHQ